MRDVERSATSSSVFCVHNYLLGSFFCIFLIKYLEGAFLWKNSLEKHFSFTMYFLLFENILVSFYFTRTQYFCLGYISDMLFLCLFPSSGFTRTNRKNFLNFRILQKDVSKTKRNEISFQFGYPLGWSGFVFVLRVIFLWFFIVFLQTFDAVLILKGLCLIFWRN